MPVDGSVVLGRRLVGERVVHGPETDQTGLLSCQQVEHRIGNLVLADRVVPDGDVFGRSHELVIRLLLLIGGADHEALAAGHVERSRQAGSCLDDGLHAVQPDLQLSVAADGCDMVPLIIERGGWSGTDLVKPVAIIGCELDAPASLEHDQPTGVGTRPALGGFPRNDGAGGGGSEQRRDREIARAEVVRVVGRDEDVAGSGDLHPVIQGGPCRGGQAIEGHTVKRPAVAQTRIG